jgi:hypothetical protein
MKKAAFLVSESLGAVTADRDNTENTPRTNEVSDFELALEGSPYQLSGSRIRELPPATDTLPIESMHLQCSITSSYNRPHSSSGTHHFRPSSEPYIDFQPAGDECFLSEISTSGRRLSASVEDRRYIGNGTTTGPHIQLPPPTREPILVNEGRLLPREGYY